MKKKNSKSVFCTLPENIKGYNKGWTTKEVRQDCPLSPTLIATYISNVEKNLMLAQSGKIVVGKAYANDMVIVTKKMKETMKSLKDI